MHGYKWPINCTRTRTAHLPGVAGQGKRLTARQDLLRLPQLAHRKQPPAAAYRVSRACLLRVSVFALVPEFSPGPEMAHKKTRDKRNQDLWIFLFSCMHARIISDSDFQTIHLEHRYS